MRKTFLSQSPYQVLGLRSETFLCLTRSYYGYWSLFLVAFFILSFKVLLFNCLLLKKSFIHDLIVINCLIFLLAMLAHWHTFYFWSDLGKRSLFWQFWELRHMDTEFSGSVFLTALLKNRQSSGRRVRGGANQIVNKNFSVASKWTQRCSYVCKHASAKCTKKLTLRRLLVEKHAKMQFVQIVTYTVGKVMNSAFQ